MIVDIAAYAVMLGMAIHWVNRALDVKMPYIGDWAEEYINRELIKVKAGIKSYVAIVLLTAFVTCLHCRSAWYALLTTIVAKEVFMQDHSIVALTLAAFAAAGIAVLATEKT